MNLSDAPDPLSPGHSTTAESACENTQSLAPPPDTGMQAEQAPVHMPIPTPQSVGRYRLEHIIGTGGLGTVWAGFDPVLGREVAIKTLPASLAADERTRRSQRFLDEARAAARLNHPHIVSVFDAGLTAQGAYIVMSLMRGKDLRALLDGGWRPGVQEACRIVARSAQALAHAHEQGVIHRDIKPANIMLISRSQPVVLDFGLAQTGNSLGGVDGTQALDGPAIGSPYYAAPEQFHGHPADQRTDIYSLGVLLYELLVGERPHKGQTLEEIRQAVNQAEPTPPHAVRAQIEPALSAVVMRAMARDPAARFASARELARALRPWRQTSANHPAPAEAAASNPSSAPTTRRPRPTKRGASWQNLWRRLRSPAT